MLTPVQPDNEYCVYCHAIASGPCATCGAMVCADCCEITGGSVKRVAVCKACHKKGHGDVRRSAWTPLLLIVLGFVGVALALGLVLRLL